MMSWSLPLNRYKIRTEYKGGNHDKERKKAPAGDLGSRDQLKRPMAGNNYRTKDEGCACPDGERLRL